MTEPTFSALGVPLPLSQEGEYVYFTDRGGKQIKYKKFKGSQYFPPYDTTLLEGIRTFSMRDGDIYFPAYLRTGTHWMFEIVGMLLNGTAETVPLWKGSNSLELHSSAELSCLPSPRFLNTHMKLSEAPEDLLKKDVKILYNLRDPKDVAVSLYHIYKDVEVYEYSGKFEDFLYLFLEGKVEVGGIFDHYRDAEKFFEEHPDIPVHIQVFEETHENILLEVEGLSDFLGLERNPEVCRRIADKCSFVRMRTDKEAYTVKVNGNNVVYRKGIVGDWRNYFTEEMLEDYYRVYEEKMAGSRFYQRYSRDKD